MTVHRIGDVKLVPVEPTQKMKQAGYVAWLEADKTQVYGEAIVDRAYAAMLAAAPKGATITNPDSIPATEGLLTRLDELWAKATPGPWREVLAGLEDTRTSPSTIDDACFLIALANAYPQLRSRLQAFDQMEKALDDLMLMLAYRAIMHSNDVEVPKQRMPRSLILNADAALSRAKGTTDGK